VSVRSSLLFPLLSSLLPLLGAGCGGPSPDAVTSAIRFDACQPLALVAGAGVSVDREAGLRAAALLWNQAAGARLSVAAAAPPGAAPAVDANGTPTPTLLVDFEFAAAPSHGYYDAAHALVLINDDLTARPLVVTIAHEVGHAFGLVHVTGRPSVMNAGNLDVEPNAGDVDALAQLWGRCGAGPAN
jgi:hypothetical protein